MSTIDEARNWLELPRDALLSILIKLDSSHQILEAAQFVCTLWYNCCKDPCLWRTIVISKGESQGPAISRRNEMYKNVVDRTNGGLVRVDFEGFGCDDLITYVSQRSSRLKHLRLTSCCHDISAGALIEALGKLPSLEMVELTLCKFTSAQTIDVINCCPSSVITFKLNKLGSRNRPYLTYDNDEALAIAANMPGLIHLHLIRNSMTDVGLEAILDNCPQLQSLDVKVWREKEKDFH